MLGSWNMKKLLAILVLGLLLIGCSKKPEKIIEKCADKAFDFFPSSKVRNEKFTKNNKFVKIKKLKKESEKKEDKAEVEFKEFAYKNFNLNADDMKETTNIIVINGLNPKKKGYKPKKFPKYIYVDKVKDQSIYPDKEARETELVNKIEKLFNAYEKTYEIQWRNREAYHELATDLFYKLKLKDKLIDKTYERFFKKCEYLRKQSPLAFDAKWK